MRERGVFPQPAENVFHVHNGVIHDHADGHGEAAEGHGIHAHAEPFENEQRDRKRERHRGQRDEGRAEIQEEEEEDDRDHDRAVADGFLEVADGVLDEVALAEHDFDFDSSGQRGPQFGERALDGGADLERVEARRFIHAEDHAHRAVHAGVAAHRLDAVVELRHVADEDGSVADGLDDGAPELGEVGGHAEIADHDFARAGVEIAAGGIARGLCDCLFQLLESDAVRGEAVRVGLHLHLLHAAANGQHLRHARDALQAPPDLPVGERAQVHRRDLSVGAAQPDEEDFAHERRDRRHARLHPGGERGDHTLRPLLHELARAVDVGAPVEFREDQREPDIGIRAQAIQPADALHGGFERLRNEHLDLLRREAGALGEDRHRRLRHVRQHLDRQLAQRLKTQHEQQQRGGQDDGPMLEREAD